MADNTGIKQFPCEAIDKAVLLNEWDKWFRAVKLYLDAEDICEPDRKKSKLLHLGGPQLQEVAFNIPGALVEVNQEENNDVFKILVDKLTEYFSPQRNSTFERHLFRNMKPMENEGLNKFLVRIRQHAAKCTFGETSQQAVEIGLKDKLIDNWAPADLKKRLLEKEYTLTKIIDLCRVQEEITSQSEIMQQPDRSNAEAGTSLSQVNRIASGQGRNRYEKSECIRCGRRDHQASDDNCPARKVTCHKCGAVGHFAARCRTRRDNRQTRSGLQRQVGPQTKRRKMMSKVNHISNDNASEG